MTGKKPTQNTDSSTSAASRKAAQRRLAKNKEDDAALAEGIALADAERADSASNVSPPSKKTRQRNSRAPPKDRNSEDMIVDPTDPTSPTDNNTDPTSPTDNNNTPTHTETPVPRSRSALKSGRYASRPDTPAPERFHIHEHTRVIMEAGITIDGDDRFDTFIAAICSLIHYAQMVDEHFAINPIKDGGRDKDWTDHTKPPASMTALGAHLKLSSNARVFEKPKTKKGEKEARNSVVFFTFAISSDVPPEDIVDRIAVDWNMLGGMRLAVKSLGFFDTCTPIVMYFLWNEGHAPTLLTELKSILSSVATPNMGGSSIDLPPLAMRKQIPRTPGQVTADFNSLPHQAQLARKAWHVEVESKHSGLIVDLVDRAKAAGAIDEVWGRQVHLTEVADFDTPAGEMKRYVKFAQRHVNFHCSMICEDIRGISELDATASFFSVTNPDEVVGVLSLRQVILRYIKLADGSSLVAEIHQRGTMGLVELVVPNTPEAEAMVLMMNRNVAAFCFHYLLHTGLDETFVKNLLRASCCPTLYGQINNCTWDATTLSIVTPQQVAEEKRLAELEKAAWYKDEFGKHMVDKMKKIKKTYSDPEAMYDLDGERSVRTLHARNDPTPSATGEIIQVEDDDDEDDEDYNSSDNSNIDSVSLDELTFDFDADDDEAIDMSMDSASKSVMKTPPNGSEADQVTANSRVRWQTASSVDDSAPLPVAGSG